MTKGDPVTKTQTYPFQLGDPVEHRGVVVTPLFPTQNPVCKYLTLDEALPRGFAITETTVAGSVPELAVTNPLDLGVLLYDGEELVGAKQNRILNVSVLVAANCSVEIPVSCVEEGRWSQRSAYFDAAGHVSHATLRRRKAEMLAARPLARGIAQGEVWEEVRTKASRMGVASDTLANSETFHAHRQQIGELEKGFELAAGQCGAVLSLGDALCLDWVSRPDAFAQLWPKLRRGYLLDALEELDVRPKARDHIAWFIDETGRATRSRQPSAGLGDDIRFRGSGVIGSGLELDGELLQLSAFTRNETDERAFGRITRPTRRRPA
jgi:hypothetical protein